MKFTKREKKAIREFWAKAENSCVKREDWLTNTYPSRQSLRVLPPMVYRAERKRFKDSEWIEFEGYRSAEVPYNVKHNAHVFFERNPKRSIVFVLDRCALLDAIAHREIEVSEVF